MNRIATNTNRSLRFPIVSGAALAAILSLSGVRKESAQAISAQVISAQSRSKQADATLSAASQAADHSARKEGRRHWYQFGRASWYGPGFQGQPTASGESYNMYAMTCAHRSLPLGSLVRVTNLRNHRSIVVRVNDRGPVPESRVVDLSYRAAHMLGFSSNGLVRVRLDLVDVRPTRAEVAQLTYPQLSAAR